MCKTVLTAVAGGLLVGLAGQPAMAQTDGTLEVQRVAVVNENPRGDSVVLGTVADSTGRCNSLRECNRRRPITKCLTWSGVQPQGNRIELSLRVAGEVGSPRQILAQ